MANQENRSFDAHERRVAKLRLVGRITFYCGELKSRTKITVVDDLALSNMTEAALIERSFEELRHIEAILGRVCRQVLGALGPRPEHDLSGFERVHESQPITYHDIREPWERSG